MESPTRRQRTTGLNYADISVDSKIWKTENKENIIDSIKYSLKNL